MSATRFGSAGLVLLLWVAVVGGDARAQPLLFSDDFESGTLLVSDTPPGRWAAAQAQAGNSLSVPAEAAHSGERGYRLSDAQVLAGSGGEGELRWDGASSAGALHLRFWFRMTPSNPAGNVHFAQLYAPGFVLLAEVTTSLNGGVSLGGSDAQGGYLSTNAAAAPLAGGWHLVELSATGVGTAAGARRLFIDTTEVLVQDGVDLSGLNFAHLALGSPWTDERLFAGELDFDDVRLSDMPQASRLELSSSDAATPARTCVPVTLRLVDSANHTARPAPKDTEVQLSLPEGAGWFSSEETCAATADSVVLTAGASEATVYLWLSEPGRHTLTAGASDFFPAQLALDANALGERVLTSGCNAAETGLSLPPLGFAVAVWILLRGVSRRRHGRSFRCS